MLKMKMKEVSQEIRVASQILFVFLAIFSSSSCAKDDQGGDSHLRVTDEFVRLYMEGKPREAIRQTFDRRDFLTTRKQEIELVILNAEQALEKLGKISAFEMAWEQKLSEHVYYVAYQMFTDRFPIYITFFLFKSQDGWVISHFNMNNVRYLLDPVANGADEVPDAVQNLTDAMMQEFVVGNYEDGLEKGFVGAEEILTDTFKSGTRKQMEFLESILGEPTAYELASAERLSSRSIRLVYFLLLESHPLAFEFNFFEKADGTWVIADFNYNDQFKGIVALKP
ncbi:hypothetical protein [Gimibacter soli]|uniref:Uncharacterized protein n=1 Tax=Gimibacter soli TaxID=3024400 RepID=A0AAE9XR53_9PROT|nr:hypothetical protein [Gimibacter soli]WCL55778.1 hypothetical protein PH603_08415 [Gimibacter soli]